MTTTTTTTEEIYDNFMKLYPNHLFLVYKFTPAEGGAGYFYGNKILEVKVDDGDRLKIYRLSKSTGSQMNSDEIKSKALSFIYDTQTITDAEKRSESLHDSLKRIFPKHNVSVFIFNKEWIRHGCGKGYAHFKDEDGSNVDIILS
jgi:hypothetical protein